MAESQGKCIFCQITHGKDPGSRLLLEKDNIVIFSDHKPASKHHYLVVPKNHIDNPKYLKADDVELIERLVSIGKEFLHANGGNLDDVRLGFHWPPFNSIDHLHLHVISPASEMKFLSSAIFKPGTLWFVSSDWLIQHLKSLNSTGKL